MTCSLYKKYLCSAKLVIRASIFEIRAFRGLHTARMGLNVETSECCGASYETMVRGRPPSTPVNEWASECWYLTKKGNLESLYCVTS